MQIIKTSEESIEESIKEILLKASKQIEASEQLSLRIHNAIKCQTKMRDSLTGK